MATDHLKQPNDGIKPVIAEIARTEVCFPNIRLIVEDIIVVPVPDAKAESSPENVKAAFRLWLSDGDKVIQGKCFLDYCYSCAPMLFRTLIGSE